MYNLTSCLKSPNHENQLSSPHCLITSEFSPDSLIDLWGSAVVKLSIISPLSVFLTN